MARALSEDRVTPADELRDLLKESEKRVANLAGSGAEARRLLENLDRIAELWPELETAGVNLRPEEGRWETLQAQVRRRGAQLVREMQAAGGLARARNERQVPEDAWWWWLDETVRAANLRRAQKIVGTLLGIAVIVVLAVFLFNRLFPTDPSVTASLSHQMVGQQAIERSGDFQAALADFQRAVELTPGDAQAWLWLGVTQETLGNLDEAQAAYARASEVAGNETDFRLGRAVVYLSSGMLEQAAADLETVLAQDPDDPQALYYLAGVYEMQQRYLEALAMLERASQSAEARQQTELTAMARVRMAMLMQQAQVQMLESRTPAVEEETQGANP